MAGLWREQLNSGNLAAAEVLPFRTDEDIAWDRLGSDDAPAVREALVIASILRELGRPDEADQHLAQVALDRLVNRDVA